MRIALISEHASPLAPLGGVDSGGQNVYVAQLACGLTRLGHRVSVFTRRDDESLPETLVAPDGYRVIHVPAGPPRPMPKEDLLPYMEAFSDYITRRLAFDPVDVVHANFFMSGLAAMQAKRVLGIPFVMTFHALARVRLLHQAAADRFPPERLAIEDRIMVEADRIIAECPQDAEDQISLYGADQRKIRLAPCGYDPDELYRIGKTVARRELGLDRATPLVLQLGRLVPRKGVDNAIRGFARAIRNHGLTARMMIVGGESERADATATPEIGRLQQVAREEGVLSRVTFAGRADRSRLKYYYSAANVFVTTPWYEPFGITPLEAMACGTPVIGSNVGGIKFSVQHNLTGLLVPPHDPEALGDGIATLLRQPDLARQLGQQAQRRVEARFTWQRVTGMVAQVYQQVVEARTIRPTPRVAAASYSSPLSTAAALQSN
ncbi:MAG: glycosyltransferase family 1 protein [Planctomycetota bacterium]|nr:MAG: glycosyltransferase family 1 protein [Planctomycetota bacterium]